MKKPLVEKLEQEGFAGGTADVANTQENVTDQNNETSVNAYLIGIKVIEYKSLYRPTGEYSSFQAAKKRFADLARFERGFVARSTFAALDFTII